LKIRYDDGAGTPIALQQSTAIPTLTGSVTGTVVLEFWDIDDGAGTNDDIIYQVVGERIKKNTQEVATLTIPSSIVVSQATGTPNAAVGPYTQGTNNFLNQSNEELLPGESELPIPEEAKIDITGLKVGIYFSTAINSVGTQVIVESTLSGSRVAQFGSPTTEDTLAVLEFVQPLPVFRGESVFVDIPAALVQDSTGGQQNLGRERFEVDNNSHVPVPAAPVLDSCTLNNPGTIASATFDVDVYAGVDGTAWLIGEKSGRRDVEISSITSNVASLAVDGVIYADETVELHWTKTL
jgi:hypothetical protein